MAIGVISRLKVQPDMLDKFEAAFLRYQQDVRTIEDGNLFFQLNKSRDARGEYTVMEQYADEMALLSHRNSEHYKSIPDVLGPYMAAPPVIEVMDCLELNAGTR